MKTPLWFLLILFFAFNSTQSLLSASSSDKTASLVYDADGHKLEKGLPYNIIPLIRGSGGGLTFSPQPCPLEVVQEAFDSSRGVAFTFSPILVEENYIRTSMATSIDSPEDQNPCNGTNIWKVITSKAKSKDKDVSGDKFVTTGGGFNKPDSCFQIVEDDSFSGLRSYQIQHCPFKCGSGGSLVCYNIGISTSTDGTKHLAPSDIIFPVVFYDSFPPFSSVE